MYCGLTTWLENPTTLLMLLRMTSNYLGLTSLPNSAHISQIRFVAINFGPDQSRSFPAVISTLHRKQFLRECLLVEPQAPTASGTRGTSGRLVWASTPFSKPSKTKYQSYKSLPTEFDPESLRPKAIQSGLDRLKITYGLLRRRSFMWGPMLSLLEHSRQD